MKIEAHLNATGKKFAIVASRFNDLIVKELTSGAYHTLLRYGVEDSHITIVHVPGAFEIPLTALKLCKTNKYDGVICLGAVIKGATDHYDYVCSEVAKGISYASLQTGIPCTFGVLTTNTFEEAQERAGGKLGNKGSETALTTLEMANLMTLLK